MERTHHRAESDKWGPQPTLLTTVSAAEKVRLGSDRWRARCGLQQVHTYIYTQFNYVHKNLNNFSNTTRMVKPFRALDSYIHPLAPMPGEGAPGPILLRLGPALTRHSDTGMWGRAWRGPTTEPKATSEGSNQLSWLRLVQRRKSDWAPIDGGRDVACSRYIHIYTHNSITYIKTWITFLIQHVWSNLSGRWIPISTP